MDINEKLRQMKDEVNALANKEAAVRDRIEQLKRLVAEKKVREEKLAVTEAEEDKLLQELGLK